MTTKPTEALASQSQSAEAVPGKPQCCMCGKKGLSIIEGDGGTECELSDGRWVCSFECWAKATDFAQRDAEIERLTGELCVMAEQLTVAEARLATLERDKAALEEGLRPFAQAADEAEQQRADGGYSFPRDDETASFAQRGGGEVRCEFQMRELRRARALLTGSNLNG